MKVELVFRFFHLFILIRVSLCVEDAHLGSKAKADQMERVRCGYNLMRLWTTEVAHSPFTASPLITDIDADGHLDIVAAPLSEAQTVISAETGKTLPDTKWPTQKLDSSIFSSPLQYDIDGDGMLDILFATSSGDLMFYSPNGTALKDKFFELPPCHVKQKWYESVLTASFSEVGQFVSGETEQDKSYLPVDAHIMATPVIADLNNDGRLEELVIPVSYYFDEEEYRLAENFEHINQLNESELEKYVVAGVTIVNLTSLTVMKNIFLDLTMKSSSFPAYVLFSPTVIDLDKDGGDLDIVIGTSAGSVYAFDSNGQHKKGFPYSMGTIHGQVTVADVNKDGVLDLVAIDTSGNVVCLNSDGTLAWEVEISGTSSPGSRLVDLDNDGYVEILITTNTGEVYAISGITGKVLDHWPIRVGHPINSNILVTKVSPLTKGLDMIFLADDGALHLISTDRSCQTHIPISETSLVQILSHDLITQSEGIEILISTNDGTLICIGTGNEVTQKSFDDQLYKTSLMLSLSSELKTPNDFLFSDKKPGIYIYESSRNQPEVTGSEFSIEFEILDPTFRPSAKPVTMYTVKFYFGNHLLLRAAYTQPGLYVVTIAAWTRPSKGHITLVLTNKNGQIFQDSFPISMSHILYSAYTIVSPLQIQPDNIARPTMAADVSFCCHGDNFASKSWFSCQRLVTFNIPIQKEITPAQIRLAILSKDLDALAKEGNSV